MTRAAPIDDDAKLAGRCIDAKKAYDAADVTRKEKAVIWGKLLAEAQKLHPTDKAFEAFLERAGGIHIRRAKVLIAVALERKEFDKHQADHAAAQQRLRDKQKAEKIEREKAKAALPKPEPMPKPEPKPDASRDASPKPAPAPPLSPPTMAMIAASARALREFETACRIWLPQLIEADLAKAEDFISYERWKSKIGKAA
jgi:hypothetical protein